MCVLLRVCVCMCAAEAIAGVINLRRSTLQVKLCDIKEAFSLRGWRMSKHWVTRYKALVLLYYVTYSQYHTI